MGRPVIKALNLISRVNYIESSEISGNSYPDLFTGLGTLGIEYYIQLIQDAKPHVMTVSQRVTLPLLLYLR